MRFIKQQDSLPIKKIVGKSDNLRQKHGPLLPNNIRSIIAGPSNCGKTNLMIGLLGHENGLKFENVYIYSKSLYQLKYQYLQTVLNPIKGIGFYTFPDNHDVIPPEKAKINSVFIFDDVACGQQDNIRAYFSMGRHNDVDSFYLCHIYQSI